MALKSKTVVLIVCCHGYLKPVVKETLQKASERCNMKLTKQLAHCLASPIERAYLLCKANSPGRNTRCSFSYLHSLQQSVFIGTKMHTSLFVAKVPCMSVASHPEWIFHLITSAPGIYPEIHRGLVLVRSCSMRSTLLKLKGNLAHLQSVP